MLSNVALAVLFWQWRPMPAVLWEVTHPVANASIWALNVVGWLTILLTTYMIDHFDLFGLKQVYFYARGKPYRAPKFRETLLYRFVRHPLMVGWLIAFWATPTMTVGHLLFAGLQSVYILAAIVVEERDLIDAHGDAYVEYRRRVPRLIPRLTRAARPEPAPSSSHAS